MSDRIELTPREREAAAEAAYIAHEMAVRGDGHAAPWGNQTWSQDKWRGSIDAALAAINQARAGDPVGTIRRSKGGNGIAVRILRDGTPRWQAIIVADTHIPHYHVDSSAADESIGYWDVIFSPGETA